MSNEEENSTTYVKLIPRTIEVAISEISNPDLEIRKRGISSLINAKPGQEGYDTLFENDIFNLLLDSFNENNLPIIGMICAAYRNLAFLNPEEADKYTSNIPISFLLQVKPNSEIIDFLSTLVLNYYDGQENFPDMLLKSDEFSNALSTWLESNNANIMKSALDLINSFAMYSTESMDFSFVKEYTTNKFPTDIRALAINILIQVDASDELYSELISLLNEEEIGAVFFEIVHDIYQSNPEIFDDCFELLISRCFDNFNIAPAALIIATANEKLNEEQQKLVAEKFFESKQITPEQCFALFNVASKNAELITEREYARLIKIYKKLLDIDTMMALERILTINEEFATSEEAQRTYLSIMKKGGEYEMHEVEFLVELFEGKQMIPELIQEVAHFKEDNEDELAELNAKIESLINM